ncbi:MAG: sel1 repeat family protein [Candidatus Puniceispirillum sp.]|nr:sel1 repeat family protein [Candidatus Puniceispirillum sp.]
MLPSVGDASASEYPASKCDALGALTADPTHQSDPVNFSDIDAAALILACRDAIDVAIDITATGRYCLQLGRGQLKNGDASSAIASFKSAAALEYPAGYFALGITYLFGDDVEKEDEKAIYYLRLALNNGVFWAAKALSNLHGDKTSKFYDIRLSKAYLERFNERSF